MRDLALCCFVCLFKVKISRPFAALPPGQDHTSLAQLPTPSAKWKGTLDWAAMQGNEWGETMQKHHKFARTLGYAITAFSCTLGYAAGFGQARACSARRSLRWPIAADTRVMKKLQTTPLNEIGAYINPPNLLFQ